VKGAVQALPVDLSATLSKSKKKPAASKGQDIRGLSPGAAGIAAKAKAKFPAILQEKLDGSSSLEKLKKATDAAIGMLKASDKTAALSLEKALREIMEDTHLSSRQKAARMKSLFEQAQERIALFAAKAVDPGKAQGTKQSVAKDMQDPGALPAVASDSARKTEKPKVFVWDLRKSAVEKSRAEPVTDTQRSAAVQGAEKDTTAFSLGQKVSGGRQESGLPAGEAPAAGAPAQTPLERLQQMAGSELAKTAGIILRDGGGEIRLVLKPESLGSVRVRLNLSDNKIEGTFIVDNSAVKQVIDGNLDSITRALSAEGFQTASLQVSVGGGGADPDSQQRQAPLARRVESVAGFTGALAGAGEPLGWDELLVNLFA
jgi:flagellar hook-length control protein FliK